MKAGEHKGVIIFFSGLVKDFWTHEKSIVGGLQADSYKEIVKQIDEKLGEKDIYIPADGITDDFPKEYRGYKIYVDIEPDTGPFAGFSTFKGFNQHYYIPHKDCKHYLNTVDEMKKIIDEHIICKNIQKLSQKQRNIIDSLIQMVIKNEKK